MYQELSAHEKQKCSDFFRIPDKKEKKVERKSKKYNRFTDVITFKPIHHTLLHHFTNDTVKSFGGCFTNCARKEARWLGMMIDGKNNRTKRKEGIDLSIHVLANSTFIFKVIDCIFVFLPRKRRRKWSMIWSRKGITLRNIFTCMEMTTNKYLTTLVLSKRKDCKRKKKGIIPYKEGCHSLSIHFMTMMIWS